MLEAIYSSKLYRSSKRKGKIFAAINDPINSELVGQLAKALGEEYKKPEYLIKDYQDKESEKNKSFEKDKSIDSDDIDDDQSDENTTSSHSSNGSPDLDSNVEENNDSDNFDDFSSKDTASPDTEGSSIDSGPGPVQESISLFGHPIVGSQMREKFKDMQQVSDEIKGLLNFNDSTQGVNRILVKENELWIYYNDDINLNNVMGIVIEILNASGYTYLEFNRLARSDNAVVFQITFKDTQNTMKSYNKVD